MEVSIHTLVIAIEEGDSAGADLTACRMTLGSCLEIWLLGLNLLGLCKVTVKQLVFVC